MTIKIKYRNNYLVPVDGFHELFIEMALLLQVQEFEDKDTALLIDRYKYLDLYPCTTSELKAVGYFVSLPFTCHLHFF